MEENKNCNQFKVLTCAGHYVDGSLLAKGIYFTMTPKLRPIDTTIESIVKDYESISDVFDVTTCIQNVKKCELTVVEITVIN